jgi:hypothetical protein
MIAARSPEVNKNSTSTSPFGYKISRLGRQGFLDEPRGVTTNLQLRNGEGEISGASIPSPFVCPHRLESGRIMVNPAF